MSKNVYETIEDGLNEALEYAKATNKPVITASQGSRLSGIPDGLPGLIYGVEKVDIHTGPISVDDYLAAVKALEDRAPWRGHYVMEIDDMAVGPDGQISVGFIRGIPNRED